MKMLNPLVYSSNNHFHDQYLREIIFEEYRESQYPDRPSRLKSIYLFDDIRLSRQYKEKYSKKHIYIQYSSGL